MHSKKGQGELITTVLIILVVLAAVAGVAYFITNTLKTKTTAANQQAKCLDVLLQIEDLKAAATTATVRNIGTAAVKTVNIYESGSSTAIGTISNLGQGLSNTVTLTNPALASGDKVEVTATISVDNIDVNCGLKATTTVI